MFAKHKTSACKATSRRDRRAASRRAVCNHCCFNWQRYHLSIALLPRAMSTMDDVDTAKLANIDITDTADEAWSPALPQLSLLDLSMDALAGLASSTLHHHANQPLFFCCAFNGRETTFSLFLS